MSCAPCGCRTCSGSAALTVITLDIFVIWALAAHGKALVVE
jgi:hypothetical protein